MSALVTLLCWLQVSRCGAEKWWSDEDERRLALLTYVEYLRSVCVGYIAHVSIYNRRDQQRYSRGRQILSDKKCKRNRNELRPVWCLVDPTFFVLVFLDTSTFYFHKKNLAFQ